MPVTAAGAGKGWETWAGVAGKVTVARASVATRRPITARLPRHRGTRSSRDRRAMREEGRQQGRRSRTREWRPASWRDSGGTVHTRDAQAGKQLQLGQAVGLLLHA